MKPILFDTNMVRAILAGTKTVTRRVVRPKYCDSVFEMYKGELCEASPYKPPVNNGDGTKTHFVRAYVPCKPPFRPGDILYVRETWRKDVGRYMYKADYSDYEKFYRSGKEVSIKWRPSIHMPREAARIFLRVTGVRVERLQDITEEQAKAEGLYKYWRLTERSTPSTTAKQAFMWVWGMIIKPADRARYGWAANPWVWVIEFERCGKPEEREGGNNGRGGN